MKQYIYATLLAVLFGGCSENILPTVERETALPPVPLEIASAYVQEGSLSVTRAVSTSLESGSIGLFLQGKVGTTYTAVNNKKYTWQSGTSKWEPDATDQTIYLNGEQADVCAYYPHNADAGYDNKTAIPLVTQDYAQAKEIFFAINKVMSAKPNEYTWVDLHLTHAYSQIELKITRENYPTECKISEISLQNATLLTSGSINITDGTVTGTNGIYSVSLSSPHLVGISDTYTRNLLMVPGTLTKDASDTGLIIVLTVDSKTMTVKIPHSQLTALEKGKKHIISLKLQGSAVESTVTTTDWSVNTLNGGTPYEPKP